MSTLVRINNILCVFVVLFCIGSCIFVYYNRKKVIVSLGQPVYLYQLCIAGILLVSPLISSVFITDTCGNFLTRTIVYINPNGTLSNYVIVNTTNDDKGIASVVLYNNNNNNNNETLTFDNTDIMSSREQMTYNIVCNFAVPVAWIGVILTNTVLFAKTYRVYKVTLFRRNQTIKPQNVLAPYIISVILSTIVLIALTVTKPMQFSTIINLINPDDSYCTCYGSQRLNITMFTIDIIIGLGILVLAWKVRNTNEEIGESWKIFILIILGVVLDIAVVVIFSLIVIDPFLFIIILLVLKSLLPIWFLICPRMYYVWYEYRHGHLPESVTVPGIGRVHVGGTDTMIPTATNNNSSSNNSNNNNDDDTRVVTIHNPE